jgi:threonine aldolase
MFSQAERKQIADNCTQFLGFRPTETLADKLREIADSPYAKLGNDHYGAGGYTEEFEKEIAALLGKEAAVFMPSGTMAQQIALRIWCDRAGSNQVAFHPTCHLEIHEQGAYRELHHLEATILGEKHRLFTLDDLKAVPENLAALLIELPQREIGGQLPSWQQLKEITDWAQRREVRTHLDGARLWECAPFYGRSYEDICAPFDSVYVSFYKIIGGLPGAALAGPSDFIAEARIWLRRHGGNLVSLAPNAIAAKIGMDKQLPRIPEYCRKAKEVAAALKGIEGLSVIPEDPPTNMMHLRFTGDKEELEQSIWEAAREHGLLLCARLAPTEDPGIWKTEIGISSTALNVDLALLRLVAMQVTLSKAGLRP